MKTKTRGEEEIIFPAGDAHCVAHKRKVSSPEGNAVTLSMKRANVRRKVRKRSGNVKKLKNSRLVATLVTKH